MFTLHVLIYTRWVLMWWCPKWCWGTAESFIRNREITQIIAKKWKISVLWVCSKKDIFTEPLGAKIEETLSETLTPLLKKKYCKNATTLCRKCGHQTWKALEGSRNSKLSKRTKRPACVRAIASSSVATIQNMEDSLLLFTSALLILPAACFLQPQMYCSGFEVISYVFILMEVAPIILLCIRTCNEI